MAQNTQQTILIVEDSEVQATVLQRLLDGAGYKTAVARDGAEGLAKAVETRPALIISDILMPRMDGYAMCAEMKKSPDAMHIPVMLLTQLSGPEDVIKGLCSGADTYITKPFDPACLLEKISALLHEPQCVNKPDKRCTEVSYDGRRYQIKSSRSQTMAFLLSTYENAVRQNRELNRVQEELKLLNEALEEKVKERTAELGREVAERKAAEAALRESEERFRTVVESASDAVVGLEPPGRIRLWNKKAEAVFGYTAVEAIGNDLHALIVPERYREAAYAGLKTFFQNGTGRLVGKTLEIEALRAGGAEFPMELSISGTNVHGVWNAIGIIRDITERKRLEAEMRRNFDEVERMNRLMVGRELKMEELREEVRAMRERVKELEGKAAKK
ncbi:MAG: response regulator [Deltaproteobacteria bacterium]|nr:response regulator [Deltaproteobacteria bacterium]